MRIKARKVAGFVAAGVGSGGVGLNRFVLACRDFSDQ